MNNKGISFALSTAIISGFSVFLSGFADKTFADPYLFTTMKNIIVALMLSSILIALALNRQLRSLTGRQWLILIVIGLIGGSIPFLLFFKGLSMTESTVAAFLHKTLLIWATIGAFTFLKEKITWHHLIGFGAILVGAGLLSPWKNLGFGFGEFLALIATFFWSAETVLIRHLQARSIFNIRNSIFLLSWGRMFFGAIFMMVYLGLIGRAGEIGQLTIVNWWWLAITSVFLFGYITTWYSALQRTTVVIATSLLALGFPITVLLKSIFVTHQLPTTTTIGLVFSVLAIWFFLRLIRRAEIKFN